MFGVFSTPSAIFLKLQLSFKRFLVFAGVVIDAFAVGTSYSY